jgi:segregation and condensation protein A
MAFQVHLENFQGPMDLLLYFIRRDELDIYDIPISRITREFIEVIEEWKRLNMVVAGEFIDMASILMRNNKFPGDPGDGDIIDIQFISTDKVQ